MGAWLLAQAKSIYYLLHLKQTDASKTLGNEQ